MKSQILKIEHLSHRYSRSWAIHDINLSINRCGIMGLLGSNGAGKSTTMNIMCGVLNQSEGKVSIDGIDMRKMPELAKQKLGFLPQNAPLYLDFTVDEYLTYCAQLRMMNKADIAVAIDLAKAKCGVSHFSKRLIKNLSGGYRQRVGIAQAIIHRPKLVVLDEPTNGLDPNQIVEVRALIREIAEDRAVIFSSHILSEIEILCDDITMIENGSIVFADTIGSFKNYIKPHSALVYMDNPPIFDKLMDAVPGITNIDWLGENQLRVFFDSKLEVTGVIVEASVNNGWQLKEISLDKSSIDEVFARLSNNNSKQT